MWATLNIHYQKVLPAFQRSLIDGLDFLFLLQMLLLYDLSPNIPRNLKYSFIAILKEGLSNIIKHSNATLVHIAVSEHPAFYQLIIEDNGQVMNDMTVKNGIGLANISDRVTQLSGQLHIQHTNGFKIFISISKEILK